MTDEPLLDPAVQADPFGYYDQLRTQQPVLRMPGTGFYVLTRYFAEESLRMLAPVQGLFRKATRDVELHGVKIPRDSILHVRYGAANRDPSAFTEPDTFDVAREHVMRHMSFGQGPHACVGAPLARQELVTAFERLLARLDDLRLDPGQEPERNPGLLFYSFKTLPIEFGLIQFAPARP